MGPILMSDLNEGKTFCMNAGGPAGRPLRTAFARLGQWLAATHVSRGAGRVGTLVGRMLATVLALALSLSVMGGAAAAQTVTAGVPTQLKFQYGGETRTYTIYVPRSLSATKSRSAFILLHGRGGSGKGIMSASKLNALADSEGFVAIYPETPGGRSWSDGRTVKGDNDDLGFILKVVDSVVAENAVNPAQVYIGGASSGGFMAERMACEASESFMAVGVVSALLSTELAFSCAPTKNLPMVYFSGTADPVVPFVGGNWLLSQPATRDFWKDRATCTRTTGPVAQVDRYNDGTTVTLEQIDKCSHANLRLNFYVIEGGGHTWPGATIKDSAPNGLTSQEISATSTMVNFFVPYGL